MRACPFALCLLGAPTLAAKTRDPANEALEMMNKGDFDKALRWLERHLGKVSDKKKLAVIHLLRGQCHLALQASDQALKAFSLALESDPSVELDPMTTGPETIDLLERARSKLPSRVAVTTGKAESTVWIDGRLFGPAPLKATVAPGSHQIEAVAPDGRSASRTIIATAGRVVEVLLDLEATPRPPPSKLPTPIPPESDAPVIEASAPPEEPLPKPNATVASAEQTQPRTSSKVGLVPLGIGVAAAGAGTAFLILARNRHRELTSETGSPINQEREDQLVNEGTIYQALGAVGIGVGAVGVVTGALMLALPSKPDEPKVSAALSPQGGLIGVSGTLP